MELTPESRDLTTFITHDGLFRFRRVCFGLASAPAAFQKMMTSILRGCKGVLCYIDDIIVYGKSAAEHSANLHDVLQCISAAGLRLNEKCLFNVQELTFLGHVVSHNGLSPLKSKVEAIVHAPAPTNTTELRSFLGLVSYYAKFVPHFADVVEPIRELLRQGASFSWGDKAAQSFRAVKQLLATSKAVHMFNPSLLPVVTTDASDHGLGAVLQQRYGNELRTVAFASRTLSQAERKYSVGEKEALACVWACEHWHVFLWGRKFELRTDHQALVTLLSSRGTGRRSTRIARWSARLLYYNFDVLYHRGSDNKVADALSRLPLSNVQEQEEEVVSLVSTCITKAQLQEAVQSDLLLQQVMTYVTTRWPAKCSLQPELRPFFYVRDELAVMDSFYCGMSAWSYQLH